MSVHDGATNGRILLDWLRWDGEPDLTLKRPFTKGSMWRSAWVNGASVFSKNFEESFRISGNRGEGIILTGTRDWRDYQVQTTLNLHLGEYGALVLRAQGLRQYYAVRLCRDGRLQIVCRRDETETVLVEAAIPLVLETPIDVHAVVSGKKITVAVGETRIEAEDDTYACGMIGLAVFEGALSTDEILVTPSNAG